MATDEERAEDKHFPQKHQDWQPAHGNAEQLIFFFPHLHFKVLSFLF